MSYSKKLEEAGRSLIEALAKAEKDKWEPRCANCLHWDKMPTMGNCHIKDKITSDSRWCNKWTAKAAGVPKD